MKITDKRTTQRLLKFADLQRGMVVKDLDSGYIFIIGPDRYMFEVTRSVLSHYIVEDTDKPRFIALDAELVIHGEKR